MNADERLAALGDTPDAIAAELHRLGVRGYRSRGAVCPLARYLRREFPRAGMIWVEPDYASLGCERFDMTDAQGDFVLAFDHGRYPELEEADV